MGELKLHDIKDIVEIPDNSIYYFSATVVLTLAVVGALAWLVYRYLKVKKRINWQAYHLEQLKKIDLSQTKRAAYEITEHAAGLEKDALQTKVYDELIARLEDYKYKKVVQDFDPTTKALIENFVRGFEK